MTRAMQGPTIGDLRDQAGILIEDFSKVFVLGAFSFPLGNLVGGYILDKHGPLSDPMLVMSAVCGLFFLFHTGVAFSGSLLTLAVTSTLMEFSMGLLDTGGWFDVRDRESQRQCHYIGKKEE